MLLNQSFDLRHPHGFPQLEKAADLAEELVKRLHEAWVSGDRDGTESVFKVGEDICCGFRVGHFDEEGVGLDAVVEAIEVEEVDWTSVIVGLLGDPEVACMS